MTPSSSSTVILLLLVLSITIIITLLLVSSSSSLHHFVAADSGTKQNLNKNTNNNNNNNDFSSSSPYPFQPYQPSSPNVQADRTPQTEKLMTDLTLPELLREMNQFDINGLFDKNDHLNGGKYGWIQEATLVELLKNNKVGSLFNSPSSGGGDVPDVDWYRKLQSRLWTLGRQYGSKVPLLFGIDSIHGASYVFNATLFPQQIGAAASFNTTNAYLLGLVSGKETRYAGIPWVFSPVLGIATQPSWPRVFETFGEDPHLASIMGVSVIEGYQQKPPAEMFPLGTKANHTVAGCAKHFIGYPDARTGRDRTPVDMPYNSLLQYYTPSFDAAINDPRSKVLSVMENYIELNGKPVVASSLLLDFFLRNEDQLNFQGMLVTDYNEIMNLFDFHKYSESYEAAIYDSLNATSIDMAMISGPNDFKTLVTDRLQELLQKNEMDEARIRQSIARVLDLKDRLGLLGDDATSPVPPPQTAWEGKACSFGCAEHRKYAADAARDSITLLQNNKSTLPLDFTSYSKVTLIGPACDSKGLMAGGWTVNWQGTSDDSQLPTGSTIKQELESRYGSGTATNLNITYNTGCDVTENSVCSEETVQAAVASAQGADIVIVCIGERHYAEKPGDIFDIQLPGGQINLVQQLSQTVDPEKLVAVLIEGRPRLLGSIPNVVPSMIHAYLPGPHGGEAIVDVLSGVVNPSGKLPITYPKTFNGAPIQYWRKYSSNTGNVAQGQNDYINAIQWPFGHGLSYTKFHYSNLLVGLEGNNITVLVSVKNIGTIKGQEAVLVYSTQTFRRITPEVQMLRQFQKLHLEPGETKTIKLQFSYLELGYFDETNCKQFQSAPYTIMVSNLSSTNSFASVRDIPLQMQQCQGWGRYFLDHSAGAIIYPTNPPQPPTGSTQDYFISSIVCFGAGIVITVIVVSFIRKRREKYNEDQSLLEPTGV